MRASPRYRSQQHTCGSAFHGGYGHLVYFNTVTTFWTAARRAGGDALKVQTENWTRCLRWDGRTKAPEKEAGAGGLCLFRRRRCSRLRSPYLLWVLRQTALLAAARR